MGRPIYGASGTVTIQCFGADISSTLTVALVLLDIFSYDETLDQSYSRRNAIGIREHQVVPSSLSILLFLKYFTFALWANWSVFPVKCRVGGSVPLWERNAGWLLLSCLLSFGSKSAGAQLCSLSGNIYSPHFSCLIYSTLCVYSYFL